MGGIRITRIYITRLLFGIQTQKAGVTDTRTGDRSEQFRTSLKNSAGFTFAFRVKSKWRGAHHTSQEYKSKDPARQRGKM